MKISTKSRCGIRILIDLASNLNQCPVQIGEISKRQNISVKYLEQLIRPLQKAEIVTSVRGPKGGHILAINPKKITLGQIVRIYELPNEPERCFCHQEKCTISEDCLLNQTWQFAVKAFYKKLDSTTVADLQMECCY